MNMNANYLAFIALDMARERAQEARLANLARSFRDGRPGILRRTLARIVAAVSVASAALARRLDERALEHDLPTHTSAA